MRDKLKLILSMVLILFGLLVLVLYLTIDIEYLLAGVGSKEVLVKEGREDGKAVRTKVVYKVLDRDEDTNIQVYKKAKDSVVNVTSQVSGFFSRLEAKTVVGSGSGCVISKEGHIITNFHVIEDSNRWVVTLSNGQRYLSKLIGVDEDNDLAVLKINAKPKYLKPIKIAKNPKLVVGQKVFAIGNPFGLQRTLTKGIISSLGRMVKSPTGNYIVDTIQTDAAINPGNSGGPLLNTKGELIGINTSILSPSGGSVGIGFAIPSRTIVMVKNELIKYGVRPSLGIVGYPLSWYPGLNKFLGLNINYGVVILNIKKGYAADKAGLRGYNKIVYARNYFESIPIGGDIIVGMDGVRVSHPKDLARQMSKKSFGGSVSLTIIRGKVRKEVKLKLVPPKVKLTK